MFTWNLQKKIIIQQLKCLNLPWYEGTEMSLERTTVRNDSRIDHSNNTWWPFLKMWNQNGTFNGVQWFSRVPNLREYALGLFFTWKKAS
jgi:hypothetical protein